jgi:adenosylmethionine-8-amino-7-oxononanoate aminotransferase
MRSDLSTALREHTWLHFTQMKRFQERPPIVITRGEGVRVWDQEGREYIDALAGLFCVNVGYGRREIADAISEQLAQIHYVSPFTFPNAPAARLSERLAKLAPVGENGRVFFVTGGSEAVETALKIARAYHRKRGFAGRTKTISRRYSYHGMTLGALSVSGVPPLRRPYEPLLPGARHVPIPYRYRCDYCADLPACPGRCADEIERLIAFEGPETIAAVIMEPVQNSGGCIVPPPDYYPRVRELCDRHGILMVMDEVICGFGRVGHWFGTQAFGVEPDIITCAKGLTSAYYPLGAAIVRKEIADTFLGEEGDKFLHGITFGGIPVAAEAAHANLDIMERERLPERAAEAGEYLMARLRAALEGHPHVGEVRGMGLFVAIELVKDRKTREMAPGEPTLSWLYDRILERGVICRVDNRFAPVLQLSPPLTITRDDIDRVVQVLAEVLEQLQL